MLLINSRKVIKKMLFLFLTTHLMWFELHNPTTCTRWSQKHTDKASLNAAFPTELSHLWSHQPKGTSVPSRNRALDWLWSKLCPHYVQNQTNLSQKVATKQRSPCQYKAVQPRSTVLKQHHNLKCKRTICNSWWHYQRGATGYTKFCECPTRIWWVCLWLCVCLWPCVCVCDCVCVCVCSRDCQIRRQEQLVRRQADQSDWTLDLCHLTHRSAYAGIVLLHECSNHVAVRLLPDRPY